MKKKIFFRTLHYSSFLNILIKSSKLLAEIHKPVLKIENTQLTKQYNTSAKLVAKVVHHP